MTPPLGSARAGLVSQVDDIPDSAVVSHVGTSWTQGDGFWIDDATDDGSQDMSVNGDPQETTLSDGSGAISWDASGDYGLQPMPSELESTGLQEWSIELKFSTTTTTSTFTGVTNGDNQSIQFGWNQNESSNTDNGNLSIFFTDLDDNALRAAPTNNPNLNDGNVHSVTIGFDGPNNDIIIIIDGSTVSLTYNEQQSPDNFGTWSYDLGLAARNDGANNGVDGDISLNTASYRLHDSQISSQTI